MTNETARISIRKWLSEPEGQLILRKIAVSVSRRVDFKKFLPAVSASNALEDAFADNHPVITEIIAELCLFIMEKADRMDPMIISGSPSPEAYIHGAFINHLKDKTRKQNMDAGRYLYKRVISIFRQSQPAIVLLRKKRSTAFSLRAAPENKSIPALTDDDLADIAFPAERLDCLDFDALNRKKNIVLLGAYFWETVFEMWGQKPVWIEVYDFVRWMARHVVFPRPAALDGDEALALSASDSIAETYYDPEQVRRWSRIFVNHLTPKEKTIFLMRHDKNMSLEKIAAALNYKNASGPHYQLELAEKKLKNFLRDLPWLSPDDLNNEAFSLFHENLMHFLKK